MDKEEIVKLREHLRRSFGCEAIQVVPGSRAKDTAEARLGDRKIGALSVDDEDGDRSFFFEMAIPVGRPELQAYLRKLFGNEKLTVVARAKKTDSVELNNGPDFLGIISADDAKGQTFTLEMAILDYDLDEFDED